MKTGRTGFIAVSVLLVAGCGGASFAEEDPHGHAACTELAKVESAQDATNKVGGLMQAGEEARQASTKSIRDAVEAVFDEEAMEALQGTSSEGQNFYIADRDKLTAACEEQGFEF